MRFRQYVLAHLLKHCFLPPVYHLRKREGLGEWTKRKPELGFNFPDKPLKVQQDKMLLSCQWPFRQQHWRVFGCPWQLIFNLVTLSRSRSNQSITKEWKKMTVLAKTIFAQSSVWQTCTTCNCMSRVPKKSVELSQNNIKYNGTIPSMKCLRVISPSSLHPVPVVRIYSWFDQVSSEHPMLTTF